MTGAAGFVGRHLTAHLVACGDDVVGTDRSEGGPDLLDPAGLDRLVAKVDPEVVFHLAGQADVGGSWKIPADTLRVNAEGTLRLLEAVRSVGRARVVTVTSADVYGVVQSEDLPLDETAPLRPLSPYAASKAAADLLALQAHLGHGMDVVRARSFNHLGPGQDDRFVCSALAARIAVAEASRGDEVRVGNLAARRDFTDVRDVARAYRCLAIDGRAGAAYNVCTGTSVAVSEVAERLVGLANRPLRLVDDPSLHRPVDVPDLRGDPTMLQTDTGWKPEVALGDTLADLLDDWRQRLPDVIPADWMP